MSKITINGPVRNVRTSIKASLIPVGTYFTGLVASCEYGGLFVRNYSHIANVGPTERTSISGQETWNLPADIAVKDYQPVDVEITYTPCR